MYLTLFIILNVQLSYFLLDSDIFNLKMRLFETVHCHTETTQSCSVTSVIGNTYTNIFLNVTSANKVQSHLTTVKPKWKLSFWLSAPSELLLLAELGAHCVPETVADGGGWWTRVCGHCRYRTSPFARQPWSRTVAVCSSHGSQTWTGIWLWAPWLHVQPPLPSAGSHLLHSGWQHWAFT